MNGNPSGVEHFAKMMFRGQPEWSVLAVEAPFDAVTKELLRLRHSRLVRENASIKLASKRAETGADLCVVVAVRDNRWTVVFRSLGHVPGDMLISAPRDAKTISLRLKARLIEFQAEDTSGNLRYEFYESGKVTERAEWDMAGERQIFKSKRKTRPKTMRGTAFADSIFSELGIYLPACYPRQTAKSCWVIAERTSFRHVECANLLELRSASEKLFDQMCTALSGEGDKRAARRLGLI
jgi:hypothetical protein